MTKLDSALRSLGWGQHFCIITVRSSPHLDAWGEASPCSVMFLNTSAPSCPVWDTQKSKSVYSIFPFRDFKRQLGIWMFYNTQKLACNKTWSILSTFLNVTSHTKSWTEWWYVLMLVLVKSSTRSLQLRWKVKEEVHCFEVQHLSLYE